MALRIQSERPEHDYLVEQLNRANAEIEKRLKALEAKPAATPAPVNTNADDS